MISTTPVLNYAYTQLTLKLSGAALPRPVEAEGRNELERLVMLVAQPGHRGLAALTLQQNKGLPCHCYLDDEAYCRVYVGPGAARAVGSDHSPLESRNLKERRKTARIFDANASLPHTQQGLVPELR